MRAIYNILAAYEARYNTLPTFSARAGARGYRAKLDKPATKELEFWANLTYSDTTVQLIAPVHMCTLWTDASDLRWGAVLGNETVSGDFPESVQD